MEQGIDYDFLIPDHDPEMIHIEILSGEYQGVVFVFGKVSVEEENEQMYLQFTHEIVEYNKFDDLDVMDFKNCIGNILISIMSNDATQGIIDESGTSNTEEFNT